MKHVPSWVHIITAGRLAFGVETAEWAMISETNLAALPRKESLV